VYIDGYRIVGLDPNDPISVNYGAKIGNEPTGREHPEMLKLKLLQGHDGTIVDGISRIGFMSGGKAAWWKDEDMADTLTRKAVAFIERSAGHPFFLYLATNNIHQPRWPHPRFRGTSGCGTRCDAIQEFDASVGSIASALDRLRLTEKTLVIVSSDNGGIMDDGYESFDVRDAHGHLCNGPLRGFKGSLWEGGNREPFIARWPGKIRPGSQSDELLCLVDMLATLAAITEQTLPNDAGPDSFNMLPALLGQTRGKPLRNHLVMQGTTGRNLAIRSGPWKLIPAAQAGQGGPQLYNLKDDLGEEHNLAANHPRVVKQLSDLLAKVHERQRSRP
jgi:arylsulfatase A-like enzyme